MKRIIVTGAAGFIGLNVTEQLLAHNYDVVAFDKNALPANATRSFSGLPGRLDTVQADIRDRAALCDLAEDADAIVHGGAVTPAATEEAACADLTTQVNIGGTINILHAAARTRLCRLLFLGSASVYGDNSRAAAQLDERLVQPNPVSLYAVTKFAAERIAQRLAAELDVDLRSVRIGSAFGPWEYDSGVRQTLSAILQVTAAAYSGADLVTLPRAGARDWIYSRDVAAAVVMLLARAPAVAGPINIALGREWTVTAWCELLQQRFPRFRYEIAERGSENSIDFHSAIDRAPLATTRLEGEVGFKAEYGLNRAFAEYLAWIDGHNWLSKEGSCDRI